MNMPRFCRAASLSAIGILFCFAAVHAEGPEKKYEDFDKVIAGAKTYDGLFKLYQKDEHVFAEILPHQFDKPFLAPIAIARGGQLAGHTLNFDEQWVIMFKRVGEKVQVIRRNVHFRSGTGPIAKALETTYTDSILMALHIRTVNTIRNTVVIDLSEIFLTNFGNLPFGNLDPNRTGWSKIKTFPRNIELQVKLTGILSVGAIEPGTPTPFGTEVAPGIYAPVLKSAESSETAKF